MDGKVRNFGDALHEVLLPANIHKEWKEDTEKMYFPLGSVICNDIMESTIRMGVRPVFIGCGWRGEDLDPELVNQCSFVGARGPHTQAELAKCGVEVPITGDPSYEIPKLYVKGEPNALALVIKHILDGSEYSPQTIYDLKADAMFSPVVENYDDIVALIQKISGARFVLAGSMHAAMVANAYNVPFAPFASEYIDCPAKWFDWFAERGWGEPIWVSDVPEGREWYRSIRDQENNRH